MLKDKTGIIFGVANTKSIATAIAKSLHAGGAKMHFAYLPDDTGKNLRRVEESILETDPLGIYPCDLNNHSSIEELSKKFQNKKLDFLVHSVAYAPVQDIKNRVLDCSRDGFKLALESSCYSFIAMAKYFAPMLSENASILTLTYIGGERVITGYNLMGIAKAALDQSVRYLAQELGRQNRIRVNAISAGPLRTLSSSAVGDFKNLQKTCERMTPITGPVEPSHVGNVAKFLVSDMSLGVTGEIIHVDNGYHVLGDFSSSDLLTSSED